MNLQTIVVLIYCSTHLLEYSFIEVLIYWSTHLLASRAKRGDTNKENLKLGSKLLYLMIKIIYNNHCSKFERFTVEIMKDIGKCFN